MHFSSTIVLYLFIVLNLSTEHLKRAQKAMEKYYLELSEKIAGLTKNLPRTAEKLAKRAKRLSETLKLRRHKWKILRIVKKTSLNNQKTARLTTKHARIP